MKQRGYGKIITISSGTAINGSAGRIHYVTPEAGIIGFPRVLAREVGEQGICGNCIAAGTTLSEENPGEDVIRMRTAAKDDRALKRVQTPEDIVGTAIFFAAPESDFITGQTLTRIVRDDLEQEAQMAKPLVDPALVTGDLTGLVNGNIPGRRSDEEKTAFAFRGLALGDLALAALAYQRASQLGRGLGVSRPHVSAVSSLTAARERF